MSEGLLGGGDELGPPLPDPPLVLVLLVEPLVVAELPLADAVYGRADTTGGHLTQDVITSTGRTGRTGRGRSEMFPRIIKYH